MENISLRTQILAALLLGVMLVVGIYKYYTLRLSPVQEITAASPAPVSQPEENPALVTVQVVGEVKKPGVYSLEEGARVNEAVELAGPTEKADLSLINLAAPLQDGKQIYVPAKGEKREQARGVSSNPGQGSGKININTAGVKELDRLNGIGPALAQRIIDYRESHGPFATIEDITKVNGIGNTLLEKIRNDITVD